MIPRLLMLTVVAMALNEPAQADPKAAQSCAATLPKDARMIFDTTLPELSAGTDLRTLVTAKTRKLAMSGTIDLGNAKESAVAAAKCLQQAST